MESDVALVCSENFWFLDGTVAVQAENMTLCVYAGILVRYSSIFGSMFALPRPEDAENYEGIPLVRLAEDTAEDVQDLFLAVYDGYYPSPRFGSCKSILALYRLSKKYDMEIVHRKTISLLGFLFPDTLSAYDAFWSSRGPISNPSVDEEILSSIDAIVFAAIDLGEHASLLAPCTLLWAVHLTGLDESALSYILSCIESHRRVAYFSNDARHNIIYAKRKLALFARRFLYPRLLSSKWSLCNLLQCIVARTRIISALGEPSGRPLDPFLPNSELFTLFSGCCPQCRTTCDDIAEGRKEAWEMLPNVFGLPPRKELREASGE